MSTIHSIYPTRALPAEAQEKIGQAPPRDLFKKISTHLTGDYPEIVEGIELSEGVTEELKTIDEFFAPPEPSSEDLRSQGIAWSSLESFQKDFLDEIREVIDLKKNSQALKGADSTGKAKTFFKVLKSSSTIFIKGSEIIKDGFEAFSAQNISSQSAQALSFIGLAGSSAGALGMLSICGIRLNFHLNQAKKCLPFLKEASDPCEIKKNFDLLSQESKISEKTERDLIQKIIKDPELIKKVFDTLKNDSPLEFPYPLSDTAKETVASVVANHEELSDQGKIIYTKVLESAISKELANEQRKTIQKFHRTFGRELLQKIQNDSLTIDEKRVILKEAKKSLQSKILSSFFYMTGALISSALLIMAKLSITGPMLLAETILSLILFSCSLGVDVVESIKSIAKSDASLGKKCLAMIKKILLVSLYIASFVLAKVGADAIFSMALAIVWGAFVVYTLYSLILSKLRS